MSVAPAALPAVDLYDGGLPIQDIFGLPVHPLVVHGAVVLLPLAAIGLLVMATDGKRSKTYGGPVTLLALAGWVFAVLAMLSGRDLRAAMGYGANAHFTWGGWLPWAGAALFGCTLVLWLLDKKAPSRNGFGKLVSLVGILVAVGTIGATIYVGHLGASLTWG